MKKKPKQQTAFSEKEIGEAIKEGAITKQYLADPLQLPAIQTTCVHGGFALIPRPEDRIRGARATGIGARRYTGQSYSTARWRPRF